MSGVRRHPWGLAGAVAAAGLAGWLAWAWYAASVTARSLSGLSHGLAEQPLQVAGAGTVRVAALAAVAALLVAAGHRWAAVGLPVLGLAPTALWPTVAEVVGPVGLGLQTASPPLWQLRLSVLATLIVVLAPAGTAAALGAGRERVAVGARVLTRRLVVPAAVAGWAAALDWADPNGPGPARWPWLAMWGLLAALLVLSVLPRPAVWAALLVLPLLASPALAFALVAGQNPVPWLRDGLPLLAGTAAVGAWVAAAPWCGRLWVRLTRRGARPAPVTR